MQVLLVLSLLLMTATLAAASPTKAAHRHRHHGKHQKKFHASIESQSDDRKHTLPPNIWSALIESNKKASDDESGPKYSDDIDPRHDANEITNDSSDFVPSDDDESIKSVAANCPKCKQNSVKMSETELANLRIEYVKNQILHKLRMTERPAPIPKDELPEPIQEGYAINGDDDTDYLNRHLDDYFAKTTQKIIFLTQGEFAFSSSMCHRDLTIFFLSLHRAWKVQNTRVERLSVGMFLL